MQFRKAYPIDEHKNIMRVVTKLKERPSLVETRPHT
jgi:hypothetical protein